MDELYIDVRGVKIPRFQIEQIEQEFGAKLIPDWETALIKALDITLQKYRADKGKEPSVVMLLSHPGEYFKPAVLKLNFLGMQVPGPYNKPAWFRFKRFF